MNQSFFQFVTGTTNVVSGTTETPAYTTIPRVISFSGDYFLGGQYTYVDNIWDTSGIDSSWGATWPSNNSPQEGWVETSWGQNGPNHMVIWFDDNLNQWRVSRRVQNYMIGAALGNGDTFNGTTAANVDRGFLPTSVTKAQGFWNRGSTAWTTDGSSIQQVGINSFNNATQTIDEYRNNFFKIVGYPDGVQSSGGNYGSVNGTYQLMPTTSGGSISYRMWKKVLDSRQNTVEPIRNFLHNATGNVRPWVYYVPNTGGGAIVITGRSETDTSIIYENEGDFPWDGYYGELSDGGNPSGLSIATANFDTSETYITGEQTEGDTYGTGTWIFKHITPDYSTPRFAIGEPISGDITFEEGFWSDNIIWKRGNDLTGDLAATTVVDSLNSGSSFSGASEIIRQKETGLNGLTEVVDSYYPFSGQINSTLIYNKELSDTEISNLYNELLPYVASGLIRSIAGIELGTTKSYRIFYETDDIVTHTAVSGRAIKALFPDLPFNNLGQFQELIDLTFRNNTTASTGKYLNSKGRPSNIDRIQDSNFWQDFSYQVSTGIDSEQWRNEFLNLAHPAGFKLFAAFILKLVKYNNWDYDIISQYVSLQRQLTGVGNSAAARENLNTQIVNLSNTINALYKIPLNEEQGEYSGWIRSAPTNTYGTPYFQPGYLYKDYAVTQYLIEAFLTPSFKNAVNDYDNYFIQNLKTRLVEYILLIATALNRSDINSRMNEQGLGHLNYIADARGATQQYGDVVLSDGAINTTGESFNPLEKTAKFIGINTLITGIGVTDISPYVRGFFAGSSSTSAVTNNNYILSNRDTDGDGETYNNSSIDVEVNDLGIL